YLEVGNEWWNPLFRPYFIWEPEKYAELCKTIINRLNEHPHFDSDKIELIFGGWAANASRWTDIVWKDMGAAGRISVAPYLLRKLDQYETIPDRYGALFADVDDYLRNEGAMLQRSLRNASVEPKISVYELNSHL